MRKNPSSRWMVVCWEDDLSDKEKARFPGLEIVSLVHLAEQHGLLHNRLPDQLRTPDAAKDRFKWRAAALDQESLPVIRRLQEFGEARDHDFEIEWPTRPEKMQFSIICRKYGKLGFGVSAEGRLGVPFSKWKGVQRSVKTGVIEDLNLALKTTWFTDREKKKKGSDLKDLLPDVEAAERFLSVWRKTKQQLDAITLPSGNP